MAAVKPSSTFAELLRRSKFASYDPSIGQVYSSHGGHLHRGNWGLKRPLPIRRRNAHITVKAVDSREEQTEWKFSDKEARFTKMWEEVGVTPELVEGPWQKKIGIVGTAEWKMDSEFARERREEQKSVPQKASDGVYGPTTAVPNVHAMSDAEFERYLNQARRLRPAFGAFLKNVAQNKRELLQEPAAFESLWRSSWTTGNRDAKMFLGSQAHQTFNSPESRAIEQQPQTFGGLTYTKASKLQSQLLHKPEPGRVLTTIASGASLTSFAGMTPTIISEHRKSLSKVDWKTLSLHGERDSQDGTDSLRLSNVKIARISQVVGKNPQDLRDTSLSAAVVADDMLAISRSNPHTPGSPEYVAHDGNMKVSVKSIVSTRPKPTMPTPSGPETTSSATILSSLVGILKK